MRSFRHCTTAAMPAGAMMLGGVNGAMAGADDGGAHAVFASPGAAAGVAPDASPGATHAGADA